MKKIGIFLRVTLAILFASLVYINFNSPLPLIVYNAKYPFFNREVLELFFILYPIINLILIPLILFSKQFGALSALIVSMVYMAYHLKLSLDLECALCAANGFVPYLSIGVQNTIFSLCAGLSLVSYLFFNSKTIEFKRERPLPFIFKKSEN